MLCKIVCYLHASCRLVDGSTACCSKQSSAYVKALLIMHISISCAASLAATVHSVCLCSCVTMLSRSCNNAMVTVTDVLKFYYSAAFLGMNFRVLDTLRMLQCIMSLVGVIYECTS